MNTRPWSAKGGLGCRTGGLFAAVALAAGGCVPVPPPPDSGGVFNNTTDPTNQGAAYIGSDACRACHFAVGEQHALHGHAHALTSILGVPPQFPEEAAPAGVPQPPEGFAWTDIAYVIGGYTKKAQFIDLDGFLLTTGDTGAPTQWNLPSQANGTEAGFAAYLPDATDPLPFDFHRFFRRATGPSPQDENAPEFQENRPGFVGTWQEAGVQCEACHGPGAKHVPDPSARDLYVNTAAQQCGACHAPSDGPTTIPARDGYIEELAQWSELLASGGHAGFDCTFCHDPHASATYEPQAAIRNECSDCHSEQNMAHHDGVVFVRGGYSEPLSCVSCHMPFATRSASQATEAVVGPLGKMGDTRTHIFRIDTQENDFSRFVSDDGTSVRTDAEGRAAVTVDFVCLRCHNGIGNAFEFASPEAVTDIAAGLHNLP